MLFLDIESLKYYPLDNIIKYLVPRLYYKKHEGRLDIYDNLIYANYDFVSLRNNTDCDYEYHKDFLDVHIIQEGIEKIYFRSSFLPNSIDISKLPFDYKKDIGFVNYPDDNVLSLNKSQIAVFYPYELHKPLCGVSNENKFVKKIILKIHKNLLGI
ncbi:MAG: YhcH/YjgK/YiaL family protein [Succinivibrionaceae bacterium]